jgi:hypothetical protein
VPTLTEKLLTQENRPVLVADCTELVNAEVKSKSGVSGFAIKAAFKTITTIKRDIVPSSVEGLIDEFVARLEPFYGRHVEAGGDIGAFVVREGDAIADALLAITDERARTNPHKTLVKAYQKLRPQGKKQVVAALPRIGQMLAKHGV